MYIHTYIHTYICGRKGLGKTVAARVSVNSNVHVHVQTSARPSLLSLMQASNTDKVFRHGFHRYYEPLLEPFRDKKGLRMLEIGVESGRSMEAWVKYFSNPANDGIHSQKSSYGSFI